MADRKIAGKRMGSKDEVESSLRKRGGFVIQSIPKDDSLVVRFMTEPEDWFGFWEGYDPELRAYFPLVEGEEYGDDVRKSFRYLVNALDVKRQMVIALRLPKDLANRVYNKYTKYGTLLDRDYELTRMGEGLDTTYDVTPEPPSRRSLKGFELKDLEAVLTEAWEAVFGDKKDDKKTEAKPSGKRQIEKPSTRRGTPHKSRRPAKDEDEDEEEPEEEEEEADEEDDEDEDDAVTFEVGGESVNIDDLKADHLEEMSLEELKALAEHFDISTDPDAKKGQKRMSANILRERLLAALDFGDEDEDEGAEDDEDESDEDESEESEDDDEDDEEEDEEEEDEESVYFEDELEEMSLPDLKNIARELKIKDTKGMSKDDLIEAILEAQ